MSLRVNTRISGSSAGRLVGRQAAKMARLCLLYLYIYVLYVFPLHKCIATNNKRYTLQDINVDDKLIELGLNIPLRTWIMDFLTTRPSGWKNTPPDLQTPHPEHRIPPRIASSAPYCSPCTHMAVWPGAAATPSSSLWMTQWWWWWA